MLVLDIETTNLHADKGFIWVANLFEPSRWRHRTYTSWTVDGRYHLYHERALLRKVCADLREAPVLITYFGSRFDLPFLRARALRHKVQLCPPKKHFDLYFLVRHHLRLSRKSLDRVSRFARTRSEKPRLPSEAYDGRKTLSRRLRQALITRCRADCVVTWEVAMGLANTVPARVARPRNRLQALRREMENAKPLTTKGLGVKRPTKP